MVVGKPLLGELLSLPHLYYLLRREDHETLDGDLRTTLRRESGTPGLIWGTWAHMRRMGTHGTLVHTMGTPVLWGIRNFFIYYVLILKTVRPLYLTVLKSSNILLSPVDKYEMSNLTDIPSSIAFWDKPPLTSIPPPTAVSWSGDYPLVDASSSLTWPSDLEKMNSINSVEFNFFLDFPANLLIFPPNWDPWMCKLEIT